MLPTACEVCEHTFTDDEPIHMIRETNWSDPLVVCETCYTRSLLGLPLRDHPVPPWAKPTPKKDA